MAAGSAANAKKPSEFVTERRTAFDASLMTVTSAPGMTPPGLVDDAAAQLTRHALCVRGARQRQERHQDGEATRVIAFAVPVLWVEPHWLPCLQ